MLTILSLTLGFSLPVNDDKAMIELKPNINNLAGTFNLMVVAFVCFVPTVNIGGRRILPSVCKKQFAPYTTSIYN
ncbi:MULTISPECIES: hypothetical protein [unclassified Mucilaginibacter]|uniref:hypothetical protein n=1 Tax=unclassified Mucilaginibacter TaxID=2617802 RepID=UPI002AC94977|nr:MULTISPECIES: hypothetical protein [unclassified Mucilaginibacter]MEB0260969.1 hypothetical protein [Mucilaginibacter sp. 10I4]MEB0279564.1 hypothetical protein [Mucilaginibacter sp. 10B2]WPX22568.1 hypothetical protein RHM67_14905 [Mucilaginibacter sp. 5C4]